MLKKMLFFVKIKVMKKFIYLTTSFFMLSCSSDSDSIQTEKIAEDNLSQATISPSSKTLVGRNQNFEYSIVKDGKILINSSFQWSSSNEKVGYISNGKFNSSIIGNTSITVTDKANNKLTATITVNPEITDIPDVPFIKWGVNSAEVISNVNGWTLSSTSYPYGDPIYTKGTWTLKYYNGVNGLWKIELSSYDNTAATLPKFQVYNAERFEILSTSDPNYYGYVRWFYNNQIDNKKVFVDIATSGSNTYYLRYIYN